MVDDTLILQLPHEVFLHVLNISSIRSEANQTLVIIVLNIFIDVINSQELHQVVAHTAPFIEFHDVLVLVICTSNGKVLIVSYPMDELLGTLGAINKSFRFGAAKIIKSLNIAWAWVRTGTGEDGRRAQKCVDPQVHLGSATSDLRLNCVRVFPNVRVFEIGIEELSGTWRQVIRTCACWRQKSRQKEWL